MVLWRDRTECNFDLHRGSVGKVYTILDLNTSSREVFLSHVMRIRMEKELH